MPAIPPKWVSAQIVVTNDPVDFVEETESYLAERVYPLLPQDARTAPTEQKNRTIVEMLRDQTSETQSQPTCHRERPQAQAEAAGLPFWEIKNCYEEMLNEFARSSNTLSSEERDLFRSGVREWRGRAAHLARRYDLIMPPNQEDFLKSLWWMSENGDAGDLARLRQMKKDPPFNSDEIQKLLAAAEEAIHHRVYHPRTVIDREEAAYQENKQEWDSQYRGEFIAVHLGQVIDHDSDKSTLLQRLDQQQRESGRFRAYVIHIGGPIFEAKGPRPERRATHRGEKGWESESFSTK